MKHGYLIGALDAEGNVVRNGLGQTVWRCFFCGAEGADLEADESCTYHYLACPNCYQVGGCIAGCNWFAGFIRAKEAATGQSTAQPPDRR